MIIIMMTAQHVCVCDADDEAHLEGSAAGGFTLHSSREEPSGRSACSSLSHLPRNFTPFKATPSFSTTPDTCRAKHEYSVVYLSSLSIAYSTQMDFDKSLSLWPDQFKTKHSCETHCDIVTPCEKWHLRLFSMRSLNSL